MESKNHYVKAASHGKAYGVTHTLGWTHQVGAVQLYNMLSAKNIIGLRQQVCDLPQDIV